MTSQIFTTIIAVMVVLFDNPSATGQANAKEQAIPIDAAAEKALLDEVSSGKFTITRTDHFSIASDASPQTLIKLSGRLERTYSSVYRFCRINKLPAQPPKSKLSVIFFADYADFLQILKIPKISVGRVSGFYNTKANRSVYFDGETLPEILKAKDRLEKLTPRGQRRLQKWIDKVVSSENVGTGQHETVHHVLFNAGVHIPGAKNPSWLKEGLACLFETPPTKRASGLAALNQRRLRDFRKAIGDRKQPPLQLYEDAVRRGKFVDIKELVMKPYLADEQDGSTAGFSYAQAWALVYYLQRNRKKQFGKYISHLSSRKPGVRIGAKRELEVFEKYFGSPNDQFVERWMNWILDERRNPVKR